MNIAAASTKSAQPSVSTVVTNKSKVSSSPVADTKAAPSTTVTLSSAALAIHAASLEARETPAQTALEAQNNDPQARRLLAKEQAAKA